MNRRRWIERYFEEYRCQVRSYLIRMVLFGRPADQPDARRIESNSVLWSMSANDSDIAMLSVTPSLCIQNLSHRNIYYDSLNAVNIGLLFEIRFREENESFQTSCRTET